MTETEARLRLTRMLASDDWPPLTADEIDDLVTLSKQIDGYGVDPLEQNWVPTWNLAKSAAEGWRWKAARTASAYSFSADGGNFNRQQVHEHCLKMVAQYESMSGIGSIELEGPTARSSAISDVVIN